MIHTQKKKMTKKRHCYQQGKRCRLNNPHAEKNMSKKRPVHREKDAQEISTQTKRGSRNGTGTEKNLPKERLTYKEKYA